MENEVQKKKGLNKTKGILIATVVVLVILVGYLIFTQLKPKEGPKVLETKLTEMGADFYENFYFDNVSANMDESDAKDFFNRFTESGIKINLDNLSRYDNGKNATIVESFINQETKTACDINNTRAVIYPKDPFGKKDYTVKAELDCGFETQPSE